MSGRSRDPIWVNFELSTKLNKTGVWAKCKHCDAEMQGLVDRLKKIVNTMIVHKMLYFVTYLIEN